MQCNYRDWTVVGYLMLPVCIAKGKKERNTIEYEITDNSLSGFSDINLTTICFLASMRCLR